MDSRPVSEKRRYKKDVPQQTVTRSIKMRRPNVQKSDGVAQTNSDLINDIGLVGSWAPFIGTSIVFVAVLSYLYTYNEDILDLLVNTIGEVSFGCGVGMVGGAGTAKKLKKEPEELLIKEERRKWSLDEIDNSQ